VALKEGITGDVDTCTGAAVEHAASEAIKRIPVKSMVKVRFILISLLCFVSCCLDAIALKKFHDLQIPGLLVEL
jgi:hypothetical protein